MTTTGMLHLGPGDLRAERYYRWTAFIGLAGCDHCDTVDSYVHWRWAEPGSTLTLCEPCSDEYLLDGHGAVLRRTGHPDDGPGETY